MITVPGHSPPLSVFSVQSRSSTAGEPCCPSCEAEPCVGLAWLHLLLCIIRSASPSQVSLDLKTIQHGGLALELLLFALLQTTWALVVCPHVGAQGLAGLLSPFSSMEAQRGDKNYLKQKEHVDTSPEGYMLARTSSGDASQCEVQK